MITITCRKNNFLKGNKKCSSIHSPLITAGWNQIKKPKQISLDQLELAWQSCNHGNQSRANPRISPNSMPKSYKTQ